ncbi:carboxymuconolactone decarboxylase family protein [Paracoccus sp. (in: a-proteobacteria)]|uniref:carboxymuconolactone decarboxylase family protein n=1 Tax=Paracoccus sp. TaxID=267 RepID=UPI002B001601|nr:carboxymuconolactone decarboxylase family protein [Paracoccus sp. (in: a-proteobacteria)]
MDKEELRARGREMRRKLAGDICADRLDQTVYNDPHMAKFGDVTQEILFAQLWPRPGLDLKTRTLVTMTCDVATGQTEALSMHLRFCRNHGWSEDEIVECIIQAMAYVGVPMTRKAIMTASQVFAEMAANGEMARD